MSFLFTKDSFSGEVDWLSHVTLSRDFTEAALWPPQRNKMPWKSQAVSVVARHMQGTRRHYQQLLSMLWTQTITCRTTTFVRMDGMNVWMEEVKVLPGNGLLFLLHKRGKAHYTYHRETSSPTWNQFWPTMEFPKYWCLIMEHRILQLSSETSQLSMDYLPHQSKLPPKQSSTCKGHEDCESIAPEEWRFLPSLAGLLFYAAGEQL